MQKQQETPMEQILPTPERIQRLDRLLGMGREQNMRRGCNIVQAEFFHIGGTNIKTLDELGDEIFERIAGGGRIKTTVRFLDESGDITRIAQEWSAANHAHIESVLKLTSTKGRWNRWRLGRRSLRFLQTTSTKENEGLRQTIAALASVAKTSRNIGIELADYSFRVIRDNEVYELLQATQRAKKLWLFIFKPNEDMLADQLEIVTYIQ